MSLQLFSLHVQQEIETTREAVGRFQEHWPDKVALTPDKQTSIYDYYPHLFLGAFPSLTSAEIRSFTLAGRLFASSTFLYDKVMDRTSTAHVAMTSALRVQAMQLEAYHLLYQLFPPEAAFWARFRGYIVDYANACIQEQRFASGDQPWQEYNEALALQIAVGKNGIARATIAGLVEMAQDDSLLQPLGEAINYFNIACQMLDDLIDWKEDLRCNLPSLLLSRVVHELPIHCGQEELAREIYYGGHAGYVIELSLESLNHADSLTADIPDLLWRSATAKLRHDCHVLLQDIDRIVSANLQRLREQPKFVMTLPPAQSVWQQMVWDGLRFTIQQWQLGFGEARHIMVFPHEQGFSAAQEHQYGDVFQRALIADALCNANELLQGQLQPVIDREASYLLSCRRTSGVGGWSYFPDLPELPSDADDLAQVMQVLLRAGRYAEIVKQHCERPLAVLLHDNAHADGSFQTWIVPNAGRTLEQEREAEWVQRAWGTGPDNDVIANLLYALTLYDQTRFAETIERGVAYLETQQEADGSWVSTWYHGPYYGTYVCLRLFAVAHPDSSAIQQALYFLRRRQHADGGWGLEDESDPLSTALSLLGLATVQQCCGNTGDPERAERALVYLQHTQEADKAWSSYQFIRMELGRATGHVKQVLSYGSRTITTAFILKAAVAWYQLTASVSVDRSADVTSRGANRLSHA